MGAVDANAIVSKGEFARLANVTPGRVSQWLSERKIDGDAIDGEGRGARIRVGVAMAQLKKRLNSDQRFANGLTTNLEPPAGVVQPAPAEAAIAPRKDDVADQIQQQRLEQLQRTNRREAIEEAAAAGRLTDAEAARQQMGRLAARMITVFEGALADFAAAIAAEYKLPQRDVLHKMRGEFTKVRAGAAATLKQQADELPELAAVEIEDHHA